MPLPSWFVEIDTAKKGEVSRADFLKYRMKSFDELDANKDGKVSLEEFLKLAEPPYSNDVPGGPSLEERRNRIRAAFQSLDLNGSGFIERAEAEAPIQSEFNQYDTDRDNKITEPEIRLIMQRLAQRQAAERQQAEAERRKGLMALNDLIDMQMRDADKLDKNNDGKISQQEYLVAAGPADGPQTQGPAALRGPQEARPAQVPGDRHQQGRHHRPARADGLRAEGIPRDRPQQGPLPRSGGDQEIPGGRADQDARPHSQADAAAPGPAAPGGAAAARAAARAGASRRRRRACRRGRGRGCHLPYAPAPPARSEGEAFK